MSKNSINFIVTILIAVVLSFILPWWSIMVAALISSTLLPLKKAAVFFIPFLGIFLFWTIYAYVLSSANDFIMAKRISELLMIGGNPYLLMLVTGLIGGIAAGFSGILGKQLNTVINSK